MPELKLSRLPTKYAIAIGIVAGAILGALLAKGVLSIVYWRREVNQQERNASELKAIDDVAKREAQEKAARNAERYKGLPDPFKQ